jgi:hypothetical protein
MPAILLPHRARAAAVLGVLAMATPFLSAVAQGSLFSPRARAAASLAPKTASSTPSRPDHVEVSLTGPLTEISLGTKYTYTVRVLSAKSYKYAAVNFFVPPSDCFIHKSTRLQADQPQEWRYTIAFRTTAEMSTEGIGVAVFGKRQGYYHVLFGKAYPVTLLPNQTELSWSPGGGTSCPGGQMVGI